MTDVVLPRLNQTGANEWADVESNDVALREVINGELDNGNLSGSAAITDANLASPNNSAYRVILAAQAGMSRDLAAATYILGTTAGATQPIASGGEIIFSTVSVGYNQLPPFLYFDSADFTVGSKTQKLRLRAQVACNATKAAIKFTFGLYPITVAGGADLLTMTLGTVVSSSTVEINEPAASTITKAVNSDFTIPANGAYALGVVTGGTLTNNSAVLLGAQLQTRSV